MVIEKVKKKKLNGERLAGVSEVKPEVYPGVFMDNFCKVVNNCGTVVPDEIVERVISLYLCGNSKKMNSSLSSYRGTNGIDFGFTNYNNTTRKHSKWFGLTGPNFHQHTMEEIPRKLFVQLSQTVPVFANDFAKNIFAYGSDNERTEIRRGCSTYLIHPSNILDAIHPALSDGNTSFVTAHCDRSNDSSVADYRITGAYSRSIQLPSGRICRFAIVFYMKQSVHNFVENRFLSLNPVIRKVLEHYDTIDEERKSVDGKMLVPDGKEAKTILPHLDKPAGCYSSYASSIIKLLMDNPKVCDDLSMICAVWQASAPMCHRSDAFWYVCLRLRKDPFWLGTYLNLQGYVHWSSLNPIDVGHALGEICFQEDFELLQLPAGYKMIDRTRKFRHCAPTRDEVKLNIEILVDLVINMKFGCDDKLDNLRNISWYYTMSSRIIMDSVKYCGALISQHLIGIGCLIGVLDFRLLLFAEIPANGIVFNRVQDLALKNHCQSKILRSEERDLFSKEILSAISYVTGYEIPFAEELLCDFVKKENSSKRRFANCDRIHPGQDIFQVKRNCSGQSHVKNAVLLRWFINGKGKVCREEGLPDIFNWDIFECLYKERVKGSLFWERWESKAINNKLKLKRKRKFDNYEEVSFRVPLENVYKSYFPNISKTKNDLERMQERGIVLSSYCCDKNVSPLEKCTDQGKVFSGSSNWKRKKGDSVIDYEKVKAGRIRARKIILGWNASMTTEVKKKCIIKQPLLDDGEFKVGNGKNMAKGSLPLVPQIALLQYNESYNKANAGTYCNWENLFRKLIGCNEITKRDDTFKILRKGLYRTVAVGLKIGKDANQPIFYPPASFPLHSGKSYVQNDGMRFFAREKDARKYSIWYYMFTYWKTCVKLLKADMENIVFLCPKNNKEQASNKEVDCNWEETNLSEQVYSTPRITRSLASNLKMQDKAEDEMGTTSCIESFRLLHWNIQSSNDLCVKNQKLLYNPYMVSVRYKEGGVAHYLVNEFGKCISDLYLRWPDEETTVNSNHFDNKFIINPLDQCYPPDTWKEFFRCTSHKIVSPGNTEYSGSKVNVKLQWVDASYSWAPLNICKVAIPKHLFLYAKEKKILSDEGWKGIKKFSS